MRRSLSAAPSTAITLASTKRIWGGAKKRLLSGQHTRKQCKKRDVVGFERDWETVVRMWCDVLFGGEYSRIQSRFWVVPGADVGGGLRNDEVCTFFFLGQPIFPQSQLKCPAQPDGDTKRLQERVPQRRQLDTTGPAKTSLVIFSVLTLLLPSGTSSLARKGR